jgi:prepilin-type N-terminal cleavage/methylation domain-containing protein
MNMRKKGFTLIEVISVVAILSIITAVSLNFFNFNNRVFYTICSSVDKKANMRIAMEFIYTRIRDSQTISFPNRILTVDGKRIYIKNNILRYDVDSQQVAPLITELNIVDKGSGLYEISLFSEEYTLSTFVKRRKA